MNQPPNPYAPPRFESDLAVAHGLGQGPRREGDWVVIPVRGAVLPPRCVVCNAPAEKRLQRKLYWPPPGIYAMVCLGVLFYVIGALITRKSAEFEMGVCARHAARRRTGLLIAWIGGLAALVASFALADQAPALIVVGLLAFLAAVVTGALMAQLIRAKRIDKQSAWLKVGRPFLDSL